MRERKCVCDFKVITNVRQNFFVFRFDIITKKRRFEVLGPGLDSDVLRARGSVYRFGNLNATCFRFLVDLRRNSFV